MSADLFVAAELLSMEETSSERWDKHAVVVSWKPLCMGGGVGGLKHTEKKKFSTVQYWWNI